MKKVCLKFLYFKLLTIFATLLREKADSFGEVAEWSIAAVLKTVEGHTSGGSNPSLSAEYEAVTINVTAFFMCKILGKSGDV